MRGCCMVLGLIVMGSAGCALHPSRPPAQGGLASRGTNDPVKPQNETGGSLVGRGGDRGPANGVLAGQVLDGFNHRRPGAIIHVTPVGGPASDAPKQIVADERGYFLIQGLQPGQSYKLEAQTREPEEPISGVAIAQPPNVVVVIKLTDEPSRLARDRHPKQPAPSSTGNDSYTYEPDRGPRLGPVPTPSQGSGSQPPRLGKPDRLQDAPEPSVPLRLDQTAQDDLAIRHQPPKASIPGPSMPGPVPFPNAASESSVPNETSRDIHSILDCPLLDLEGKTTTLQQHGGSLMLVDIWGTWCAACTRSLPELAQLDQTYGPKGLKMIGVAYEDGSFSSKSQRVAFVAQRSGVRYPMLLGQGDHCPLLRLADVRRYPTLILVDEQGRILWKGEGLTPENRQSLENLLQDKLGS